MTAQGTTQKRQQQKPADNLRYTGVLHYPCDVGHMENHIFGEPVPVIHYPVSFNDSTGSDDVENGTHRNDDNHEPSWTVDVIRKGSNVVVGTIVINNTKLPPRRNKNKKIVWKLPSSNSSNTEEDIPRFGKQDYPRLWEIYKEEKKKRRSLNKAAETNISSNTSICDDSINIQADHDNMIKNLSNDQDDSNNSYRESDNITSLSVALTEMYCDAPTQPMTSIAPPPGFESALTKTSPNNKDSVNSNHSDVVGCISAFDRKTATTTTSASTIRPPPGFA